MWAPMVGWLLWRSFAVHAMSIATVLTLGVLGLVIWTLTEYVMHRFVFHFKPFGPISERVIFLFHGIHHDDPEDGTRLVMPPVPGILLAVLLYSTFRFLLGTPWVEPFFAFFLIGYLCYDYIHYSVHHFTPRTSVGKFIKQYHMLHHFASPEARWGVSSPLWDYVFGTVEQRTKAEPKAS
jgi:sterol desaturase/sphingolipid hydroxylase (fatty acid hydroxylase superfamily)